MHMPPKKTTMRIDITLPISLVDRLRTYADEKGVTLSGVVSRALQAHLDGGGGTPSPPGQQAGLPSNIDEMLTQRVEAALLEYLTSEKSDALFERLSSRLPAAPMVAQATKEKRASKTGTGIREGKVMIPEDLRARLQKYGPAEIEHATGDIVTKGTVHGIIKKGAKTTSPVFLEALIEAADRLEAGM